MSATITPSVLAITLNPLTAAKNAVSGAFKSGFHWMIEFLVTAVVRAVARVVSQIVDLFSSSERVSLTDGWWNNAQAQAMLTVVGKIAGLLLVLCVLLAVVEGIIRSDVGAMARAVFVQVPIAFIAAAGMVTFTTILLGVTDEMSRAVLGSSMNGDALISVFGDPKNVISGGLLSALLAVVFLVGSLVVWVELVVRSALIYLLVAISPIFLAMRVWAPARKSFRRLVEVGLAIIAAKPVISIAIALGMAALQSGTTTGSLGTQVGADLGSMLTAAVLMLLAIFSPFVILKLIPVVEAAVVAQEAHRPFARAGMAAAQGSVYSRMLAGAGAGSGGGAQGGSPKPGGTGSPGGAGAPSGAGASTGSGGGGGTAAGGAAAAAQAAGRVAGRVQKTATDAGDITTPMQRDGGEVGSRAAPSNGSGASSPRPMGSAPTTGAHRSGPAPSGSRPTPAPRAQTPPGPPPDAALRAGGANGASAVSDRG